MLRGFSDQLRDYAHCRVRKALRDNGIVDIVGLSEAIRIEHLGENFAREDIESLVMQVAQIYGAPMEFDEQALMALDLPEACGRDNFERALDK
jgi:hypothetical protein